MKKIKHRFYCDYCGQELTDVNPIESYHYCEGCIAIENNNFTYVYR